MKKRAVFAILLALTVIASGICTGVSYAPRQPEQSGGEQVETATLMVYMTGSDLESSSAAATNDLQEMAESGIDLACANVVVYTGGAQRWRSDVPADVNALLELKESGFEQVGSFDRMSMGESENLSRFLRYAYENYPADRYYLILWDHGNGPVIGYCRDKLYGNDTLTLPEMQEALQNSPFSAENKLGFIGFDACLMASAELICTVGDYADFLVASQETEPYFGWDYAFLAGLGKQSPKELACAAADRYYEYCEAYYAQKPYFNSDVTMSVTDLQYANELKTDICALFQKATPDVLSGFSRIAVSRVNTRAFGRASTGSEYDLVDLKSLSDEFGKYYPEETKALNVLLDRMVVHAVSNTEQSCGVSLYYPFYNKNYYRKSWKDAYREMNVFPEYLNFLNRYEQMWLASDMQELFDTALTVEPGTETGTYFLPLSGEQLEITAEARYYILHRVGEATYSPVYMSAEVQKTEGGLLAEYDGSILYYEDAFGLRGIPATTLKERIGTRSDYSVGGFFLENNYFLGKDWTFQKCDLQLSVDASDHSVEVKGIYMIPTGDLSVLEISQEEPEAAPTGKRQEVDLSAWKLMLFSNLPVRHLTRTNDGRIIRFYDWTAEDVFSGEEIPIADQVHFISAPLYDDGEEYCILFELTDVQGGQICSEPYPLQLEKAPPASKPEPTVIERGDDGAAEITIRGIRLRIRSYRTIFEEPLYAMEVTNLNDFHAEVRTQDYSADAISRSNSCLSFSLEPGETEIRQMGDLNKLVRMTGKPQKIRFTVSVVNSENEGTICRDLPLELDDGDFVGTGPCLPMLGACAEEQVLYAKDGIEVTLLGLGFYPKTNVICSEDMNATLTAYYRIDNLTDIRCEAAIPAFCINGAEVMNDRYPITETEWIEPHRSFFICQTIEYGEAIRLLQRTILYDAERNQIDFEKACSPLIDAISSVSVLVIINGEEEWCPVRLKESGDAPAVAPRGTLLYEDETWRVTEEPNEEGAHPELALLWIENRTDKTLFYHVRTEECDIEFGSVGPNAVQRVSLMIPEAIRKSGELTLHWCSWEDEYNNWRSMGKIPPAYFDTEPFRTAMGREEGDA